VKTFEEKLMAMETPRIEDPDFEHELRRNLLNDFFEPARKYRLKLQLAMSAAALLAVFSISLVTFPRLAYDLHALAAFEDSYPVLTEPVETIPASIGGSFAGRSPRLESMPYTSIFHPGLARKIEPSLYKEEKAYIIRKYSSPKDESVMIVSEFERPGDVEYSFASY